MSKILSFDVGIKNLAYCILNDKKEILDWNVLNIIEDEMNCCECGKKATCYTEIDNKICYCKKHAVDNVKPIVSRKVKTISTREISESLFNTLDLYPQMLNVNTVIVENQPCLMNPMIKSVQMLIYSYFMIKGFLNKDSLISDVKHINARNKLKNYDGPKLGVYSKNKYTQRKKEAIEVCKYFLKDNNYLNFFESHKKKDDLADCYLQGLWFINN